MNINFSRERTISKKDVIAFTAPVAAGTFAAYAISNKISDLGVDIYEHFDDSIDKTKNFTDSINEASKKVFDYTKLSKKGVRLVTVPVKKADDYTSAYKELLQVLESDELEPLHKLFKDEFLTGVKRESVLTDRIDMLADVMTGNRGIFFPNKNLILIPDKKENIAVFHEMGHAISENLSRLGKTLSHVRDFSYPVAIGLAAIALLNPAQSENKTETKLTKPMKFIQNNAGKLTFAALLPISLEEALASYNGEKAAKKFLNNDVFEIVKKTDKLALLSYIITALAFSVGVTAGVKIKKVLTEKLKNYNSPFLPKNTAAPNAQSTDIKIT